MPSEYQAMGNTSACSKSTAMPEISYVAASSEVVANSMNK
jgi:hypothetical protein